MDNKIGLTISQKQIYDFLIETFKENVFIHAKYQADEYEKIG